VGKRSRGADVKLDSFLDIMTCLLGSLILILLLTSIDASQIQVLIPTPIEHRTDKKPIYIECRNNELFLVPVKDLQVKAQQALKEISEKAKGDTGRFLEMISTADVEGENYRVDLTYALTGQWAIIPKEDTHGYTISDIQKEKPSDWYGRILTGMDKDKEMLSFLVRDDSYEVFKAARALAWQQKVEVAYELLDVEDEIKFGLGGSRMLAQ